MAKLRMVRITLITLQLISLTIASVILIVHYNPWIERMIDEAERSGNTSQSLADQIGRVEGEEIVIFLMSAATILVSILGIIGTLRGHEHNHCLLNFYMSTLIIFLFVIFMALCGTIWEVISKLQYSQLSSVTNPFDHTYHLIVEGDQQSTPNQTEGRNAVQQYRPDPTVISTAPTPKIAQSSVTWLYIGKSLLFISLTAALYATSLRLTRKILESSDDRYLSASDDGDEEDLNSEASSGGGGLHHYVNTGGVMVAINNSGLYSNHSFNNNFPHNIADSYSSSIIAKPGAGVPGVIGAKTGGGCGSPYRNI